MDHSGRKNKIIGDSNLVGNGVSKNRDTSSMKNEYTNAQSALSQVQNYTNSFYEEVASVKNGIDKLFEELKFQFLYEIKYLDGSNLETDDSNKVVQELDWLRTDFIPELRRCVDGEKENIK